MGAAALAFARTASLVFPVRFRQKNDIDTPDHNWAPRFERLGWISQIAPDHVPAGVIVMGLDGPRAGAPLRFQCLGGRRIQFAIEGEVWKPLLRHVRVLVFLVWADGMERFHTEYADDGAEDIRLLEIQIDQFGRFILDVVNGFSDMKRF